MSSIEDRFYRYLLASRKDQDWGLYVTDAGRTRIFPNTPYPPPGHPPDYNFTVDQGRILRAYQVVYITHGGGYFETKQTGLKKIEPGNAFLLFPNQWHRYWPLPETGWNEHWVGFDGETAKRITERGFFTPQKPIFNAGYDEYLVGLFDKIIDLIKNEPFGFQQTIASLTMEILSKMNSLNYGESPDSSMMLQVIREAKSMLAERIAEPVCMQELAESLGVSYSWFRWAFKTYTGFPPHQYLLEMRMERAKFLLSYTKESIKEISNELGFDSPYYFSRLFKKKNGKNPSDWRKHAKIELQQG
ncbi:MAG: AraC family transcriptional regulator [bacterium]|nr:AraC family transcriptional regulator [bacterium]